MVYVYAITELDVALPAIEGFEGAALRTVDRGDLVAVVSDLEQQVPPTEAALWVHESVVEELMATGPVLPMRFGSTLADEAAVDNVLSRRYAELVSGLSRVRGAVELGVRAVWDDDDPGEGFGREVPAGGEEPGSLGPSSGAGTTYLMRRLGQARAADALVEQVHAPLEVLSRTSTCRTQTAPRVGLTAAYLVDETKVDEFRARAEELDEGIEAAGVVCTGPWPPYSFTPAEEAR